MRSEGSSASPSPSSLNERMKVVGIYVTRSMRDDPVAVEGATLVQGLGVRSSESEEDRYFGCGREPGRQGSYSHKPEPGRQVTLISSLALDGVLDGFGGVSVRDCRRNVEISASPEDLNALVGSEVSPSPSPSVSVSLSPNLSGCERLWATD